MARVGLNHLLLFTREFASLIASRLQLVQVLDNLARETPQRVLRTAIEDVSHRVRAGVDLGDALAAHPGVFSDIYVNTVRAGMMSGNLADSLFQVSEYLETVEAIGRKIRRATAYPLFIGLAFVAIAHLMVFMILPRFETMFANFGKDLPPATQVFLEAGHVYADIWPYVLTGGAVIIGGFLLAIGTREGRLVWDEVKLGIPLLGRFWRLSALSRFLRTMAVQLRNHVPLLTALQVSASASGNLFIQATLREIVGEIERGRGMAACFGEHRLFEGIVQQMIAFGEESGVMDEMMISAATYFDGLLADRVDFVTSLINPLLTAFVGMATAAMLIAAFLPVFDISGAGM